MTNKVKGKTNSTLSVVVSCIIFCTVVLIWGLTFLLFHSSWMYSNSVTYHGDMDNISLWVGMANKSLARISYVRFWDKVVLPNPPPNEMSLIVCIPFRLWERHTEVLFISELTHCYVQHFIIIRLWLASGGEELCLWEPPKWENPFIFKHLVIS